MSKKKSERNTAAKTILRNLADGVASDYLEHLPDAIKGDPDPVVVLYVRVSRKDQVRKGNLYDQAVDAAERLEELGVTVIIIIGEQYPGRFLSDSGIWPHEYRLGLEAAIYLAKTHDAILVAASRDRLLRGTYASEERTGKFRPEHETPSVAMYEELMRMADGVRIATIEHPDTPAGDIRGQQTKRGHKAKERKGGRPAKKKPCPPGAMKAKRVEQLPVAIQLYRKGWGYKRIAKHIGRSTEIVRYWIGRHWPDVKLRRRRGV